MQGDEDERRLSTGAGGVDEPHERLLRHRDEQREQREQERVPVAQRHVEGLGELQDHLGAGARATRLEEAQVTRRDAGLECQVELTHAPPPAPIAQQRSNLGPFGDLCHGSRLERRNR